MCTGKAGGRGSGGDRRHRGVTEQDAKITGIAHERGKGIVIVVNKWDAIEKNDRTMREYEQEIRRILSFVPYAEIMYVSAQTGQRLQQIYDRIDMVIENQTMRIATGVLNEIIMEAVAMQQPPSDKGKRLKLYYATQVAVKPPTFVLFVNDRNLCIFPIPDIWRIRSGRPLASGELP